MTIHHLLAKCALFAAVSAAALFPQIAGAAPPQHPAETMQFGSLAWHKLVVNNVTPEDVLRLMHWQGENKSNALPHGRKADGLSPLQDNNLTVATNNLPEGVKRIYALKGDNSLLIQATPEGFQRVREIVKNLAIEPKQIQLSVLFVRASMADVWVLSQSSESGAGSFLEDLLQRGSQIVLSRTTTTHDNLAVSFPFQARAATPSGDILPTRLEMSVTPRLNPDETITLLCAPAKAADRSIPQGMPDGIPARRTLRSGETMVLDGGVAGQKTELLVFITPTLISLEPAGNESGQNGGMIKSGPHVFVTP